MPKRISFKGNIPTLNLERKEEFKKRAQAKRIDNMRKLLKREDELTTTDLERRKVIIDGVLERYVKTNEPVTYLSVKRQIIPLLKQLPDWKRDQLIQDQKELHETELELQFYQNVRDKKDGYYYEALTTLIRSGVPKSEAEKYIEAHTTGMIKALAQVRGNLARSVTGTQYMELYPTEKKYITNFLRRHDESK